jgi:rod shape-determining protein MreC
MAAPAGPRPGWSRRAQYSLFFGFIAAIAGLVVGIIMLVLSLVAPASYSAVRGAALDVTSPISGGLAEVSATAKGLVSGAGNYWDSAHQNSKLKAERTALRRQLIHAAAILQENRQLKAALGLRQNNQAAIAAGRIVGSSFNSPRRFAILSAGAKDGIREGMPVRSPDGLGGRIIDVGQLASRVQLIYDRTSIVTARLLRNGIPVIAQGNGDGTVEVRPLEVGRNPFRPGDLIISSGTGGLYPPLVPVARVVKLKGDEAIALPLADPATTSFAIVEPPYEPAAMASENQPSTTAQ